MLELPERICFAVLCNVISTSKPFQILWGAIALAFTRSKGLQSIISVLSALFVSNESLFHDIHQGFSSFLNSTFEFSPIHCKQIQKRNVQDTLMRFGSFWSLSVVWVRLMPGRIARLERTQLCGDSQALQVPCHPAGSSCEPELLPKTLDVSGSWMILIYFGPIAWTQFQWQWLFSSPQRDTIVLPACALLRAGEAVAVVASVSGFGWGSRGNCQSPARAQFGSENHSLSTSYDHLSQIIWVLDFMGKNVHINRRIWLASMIPVPSWPPTIGDASISISVNAVWPLSRSLNTDIATRDGLENLGKKNGNNPKSSGFYHFLSGYRRVPEKLPFQGCPPFFMGQTQL